MSLRVCVCVPIHYTPSLGDSFTWEEIWSYRRSIGKSSSTNIVLPGEISNQNWESGNDYGRAYLLLSEEATRAQATSQQGWAGGINLTSSAGAESTAFGWVTYFYDAAPAGVKGYLSFLSSEEEGAGTDTGLSKMPYLRDTRRSVGLDGFRLFYANLTGEDDSSTTGQATVHHHICIYIYIYLCISTYICIYM